MTIKTGDFADSGTDANVYVQLFGEGGRTGINCFKSPNPTITGRSTLLSVVYLFPNITKNIALIVVFMPEKSWEIKTFI